MKFGPHAATSNNSDSNRINKKEIFLGLNYIRWSATPSAVNFFCLFAVFFLLIENTCICKKRTRMILELHGNGINISGKIDWSFD